MLALLAKACFKVAVKDVKIPEAIVLYVCIYYMREKGLIRAIINI